MLDGIRILDLSEEPGFLAGKMLGDLGADVVKLEPPGGDRVAASRALSRRRRRSRARACAGSRSTPASAASRSTSSTPRGRELFRRLAARADVVLETAAPGALEALGVGWDDAARRAAAPGLVLAHALRPHGTVRAHLRAQRPGAGRDGRQRCADRRPRPRAGALHAADRVLRTRGPEAAAGIAMALSRASAAGAGSSSTSRCRSASSRRSSPAPGRTSPIRELRGRTGARLGRHARDLAREGRLRELRPARRRRRACPSLDGDRRAGWRRTAWRPRGCASWTGSLQPQPARRTRRSRGSRRPSAPSSPPRRCRELFERGARAAHHAGALQRRARDPGAAAAARARVLRRRSSTRSSARASSTRISSRSRAARASGSGAARRGIGEHNAEVYGELGSARPRCARSRARG